MRIQVSFDHDADYCRSDKTVFEISLESQVGGYLKV